MNIIKRKLYIDVASIFKSLPTFNFHYEFTTSFCSFILIWKLTNKSLPRPIETKDNTKEKPIQQWHAIIEERRMKDEKHCIAAALDCTKKLNCESAKKFEHKNATKQHEGNRKHTSL